MSIADRYGIDTCQVIGYEITGYEQGKGTKTRMRWVSDAKNASTAAFTSPVGGAFDTGSFGSGGHWEQTTEEIGTRGHQTYSEITLGSQISKYYSDLQGKKGSRYVEQVLGMSDDLVNNGLVSSGDWFETSKKISEYFSGYSQNQMSLTSRILSGDMGAMSYAANTQPGLLSDVGMNPAAYKFMDLAGRSISESSGSDFLRLLGGQTKEGNPYAQQLQRQGRLGSAAAFLGIGNQEMANVWATGGNEALGWYMMDQQWSFQQQGFNLQQQQTNASNAYTRQMWGFEDQQRSMQYQNRMADFAYSGKRMDLSNQYSQEQESISWTRMNIGNEYNKWQIAFGHQTDLMQRKWTQEDWQVQDQQRSMQYGWQMEDLNEAIRFSSGRERRKLVRQRDRAAISQNMEEEQIDTQRDRQRTMWGREDERYKKLMEYTDKLSKLDIEQFNLNKQQREEMYELEKSNLERNIQEFKKEFELQGQIQKAQRDYQEMQMEFQQRSFDLSKQQAELQHDYETATRNVSEWTEKTVGYVKTWMENDPEKLFKPLMDLIDALKSGNVANAASAVAKAATAISKVDPTKATTWEKSAEIV